MAALGQTAALQGYVGYWLARHRKYERVSERDLLERLGIHLSKLAALALCAIPRPDHFEADVQVIAARCGVNPTALADLLRTEQARKKAKSDATRPS
jgi:hypothetical protein